jgi:hypothetical protein
MQFFLTVCFYCLRKLDSFIIFYRPATLSTHILNCWWLHYNSGRKRDGDANGHLTQQQRESETLRAPHRTHTHTHTESAHSQCIGERASAAGCFLRAPATATTTKATSLQHILPAVFHLNFLDMGCAVAARLLQEVRHPLQEQQLCLARPSSRWPVIIMMLKL